MYVYRWWRWLRKCPWSGWLNRSSKLSRKVHHSIYTSTLHLLYIHLTLHLSYIHLLYIDKNCRSTSLSLYIYTHTRTLSLSLTHIVYISIWTSYMYTKCPSTLGVQYNKCRSRAERERERVCVCVYSERLVERIHIQEIEIVIHVCVYTYIFNTDLNWQATRRMSVIYIPRRMSVIYIPRRMSVIYIPRHMSVIYIPRRTSVLYAIHIYCTHTHTHTTHTHTHTQHTHTYTHTQCPSRR
jgi:hypothetical protein